MGCRAECRRSNDAKIAQTLRKGAAGAGKVARNDGDVDAAIKGAARVMRADYELPLLAHATLEPQNCTADVRADGVDIYVPTQVQQIAQATAAKAAGLDPSPVKVHTTFLGGGFGRRLEVDFIPAAVEASKAVKKPVKLVWTREDDMTHDAYRPPAFDQVTAAFDAKGKLTAWKLHLTGPSITARMFPSVVEKMVDPFAVEAATNYPYDVPNVRVDFQQQEIGIDVGYWRSVSHALNCFVAESFMDELAVFAAQELRPSSARRCWRSSHASSRCSTWSRANRASATRVRGNVLMAWRSWRATAPTWRRWRRSRWRTARCKLKRRVLRRRLRPADQSGHGRGADRKFRAVRLLGVDVGRDQPAEAAACSRPTSTTTAWRA